MPDGARASRPEAARPPARPGPAPLLARLGLAGRGQDHLEELGRSLGDESVAAIARQMGRLVAEVRAGLRDSWRAEGTGPADAVEGLPAVPGPDAELLALGAELERLGSALEGRPGDAEVGRTDERLALVEGRIAALTPATGAGLAVKLRLAWLWWVAFGPGRRPG